MCRRRGRLNNRFRIPDVPGVHEPLHLMANVRPLEVTRDAISLKHCPVSRVRRRTHDDRRLAPGDLFFHNQVRRHCAVYRLATQAQRPGPQDAWIATEGRCRNGPRSRAALHSARPLHAASGASDSQGTSATTSNFATACPAKASGSKAGFEWKYTENEPKTTFGEHSCSPNSTQPMK